MTHEHTGAVPAVYAIDAENNARPKRDTLKPKRKRNRSFIIITTAVVIMFATLFITLFLLYRYMYPKSSKTKNVCDSEDCIRMAAVFKRTMDLSVDPCENFVEFACGKWPQSYLKPDSYSGYSWVEYLQRRQNSRLRDLLRRNLTDVYGAKLPRAVLQAQTLYNSCVDTDTLNQQGLNPLIDLLKEFGLPKVPPVFSEEESPLDLVVQAARIKRLLYRDVFFKVEVYVDLRNVTQNLIVIGSPDEDETFRSWFEHYDVDKIRKYFKMTRRNLYNSNKNTKDEDDDDDDDENELEEMLMANMIREMISNTNDSDSCQNISLEDEKKLEELVSKLTEIIDDIHEPKLDKENQTTTLDDAFYNIFPEEELMFVDTLQNLTDEYVLTTNPELKPQEIWKPFIEELFKDILKPNWHTKNKLWVYDMEHLQWVAVLFANKDRKLLETVAWWTVVEAVAPFTSKNLRNYWTEYIKQTSQLENTHSRSIQCVSLVNNLMGIATSWLYFDKDFIKKEKPHIQDIVRYMKSAFANFVIGSDWLDKDSKIAILRKNSQPLSAIGYPAWLFIDGKVDEFYHPIPNLSETKLLDNVISLMKPKIAAGLEIINTFNHLDIEFWIEPVIINAFHSYYHNQIIIPASILKFPFYSSSLKAVNYGFIGAGVIGHELAHGFDDLGRRFDESGNLKQWWSNETIAKFSSRAKCFIDHYNDYYIDEVKRYIDGEETLNENLADVLGLKQAFYGYQQWKERHEEEPRLSGFTNFSHEQLFFLSYAVSWCQTYSPMARQSTMSDTHAPNDIRIFGALRNSKEFSDAWKCPVGSYMNPEDKCTLW